jgi:prophage antirepressor-like protein
MSNIVPFQFGDHEIRIQVDNTGNPWWVAKDVCEVLEVKQPTRALKRLDDDEKGVISIHTPGGIQDVLSVNEGGLYSLVLGSRKTEAKAFKRWVTHEVIPAIRKTGQYSIGQQAGPVLPERKAELLLIAQAKDLLADLGQLTARDKLMLADQARNVMQTGQRLLPAPASATDATTYGFSVAERVTQLGYQLSRKEQAALYPHLGKRIAQEWRSRHEGEPAKETRWVDGAQRQVAWYAQEDSLWIDVIIQSYLSQFPSIARNPFVEE